MFIAICMSRRGKKTTSRGRGGAGGGARGGVITNGGSDPILNGRVFWVSK